MSLSINLNINGMRRTIELDDPRVTLLDLLRERLDLTGTKKGCDRGQCGACTVLVDGRRINSCLALAVSHDGAEILTIEGVAPGKELHPVQAAFIAHDGFQCGFCTPGHGLQARLGAALAEHRLCRLQHSLAIADRVRARLPFFNCRLLHHRSAFACWPL